MEIDPFEFVNFSYGDDESHETTVNVTADALDPSDLVVALGGSWSEPPYHPSDPSSGMPVGFSPLTVSTSPASFGLAGSHPKSPVSFELADLSQTGASSCLPSDASGGMPAGSSPPSTGTTSPAPFEPPEPQPNLTFLHQTGTSSDRKQRKCQSRTTPTEPRVACTNCRKGKRACDGTPTCRRCLGKGIECIFDRPRPPRKLSPSPSTEGVPSASTKGVNIPSASTEGASTDLPYLPQPSSAPLFDANGLPTLFIIEYLNTFVQKDPSSAPLFDMNDYPTIVSMFEYFNAPPWLQNEHDLKGRGMQQFNEVILQGGDPGLESASASTQPSNPVRSQEPHPTSDNPQGIADFDTKVLQNQKPTLPSSENVLLSQQPSHMAEQSSISNRLGPAQPEEITAEKKKKWLIQAHIILTGLIHISYGPNAIP